ncbi:GNAT family N-acetyltransferase [Stappia sp.]|uniref:GNAT family N-acetyltransferase n=1 Tax=Stappia sp. TaxID=1870903 RepID=UPI0032D9605C
MTTHATPPVIETERLILRPWRDSDYDVLAEINADPEVMRYFPAVLDRAHSDALLTRARQREAERGICFRPAVEKGQGRVIGFVGLNVPEPEMPFGPCVEIGWRLARSAWGHGYASEGARAWLRFGFETLGLTEIVSFTTVENRNSRRVMERLGMRHDPHDDFDHPALETGHPLRRHVLYRLSGDAWRARV